MNAIVQTINAAGRVFVGFALPMLIQSSVLIVILLAVDVMLRRKVRAVFRYWIWMLVLVKLVLPPSLGSPVSLGTWFGDRLEVSTTTLFEPAEPPTMETPAIAERILSRPVPTFVAPPAPGMEKPAPQLVPLADGTVVEPSPRAAQIKEAAPAQPPAATLTWQGLVLLLWSATVTALLLLLLQRAFFVRGLVVQAEEPNQALLNALEECRDRIALRGPVALKVSPNASSPAVCGLWKPVILIPHNLAPKLYGRDLQAVLLHELAHVKRGDLWINLAQTLLQIVYFYHPLLWLANAAIRRVREQAVDEAVLVAMGEAAQEYPETLVNIAKLAFRKRPALSLRLIGVVESKSALTARIRHILNRPIPKTAKLGLLGLLVVVLVAAVILPMAKARPMTDRARDVLALAEEEARALNHEYLGTEHILVALSRRSDAASAQVLDNLGVNADTLRTQMRTLVGAGSEPSPASKLPQTARAQQTLKRATDEARSLGHDYIGTEHLLLALMKDRQSVAAQMLHGLGLTAPQVRAEILKLVRPGRMNASEPDTEDRATVGKERTSSPFVANLPNGVTVELLGVCEHPSQGRQWWRPDGSPLEEVPYDRIDGKASPDENEAAFEFAVRVLNLPEGAETRIAAEPATSAGGGSSPAFKGGWPLDELRWLVAEFGADVQTCTIRVGVAAGPWQTVVRSSGREAVAEWTSQGSIEFSKAREDRERGVCITVTDHMLDQTSRVVAVTAEGRLEQPWHSGASSSHGVRETRVDFPELSLSDVSEFLFQTRAWTWAKFENVPLRPGPTTPVRDRAAPQGDKPAGRPTISSSSADTDGDGLSDFQEVHKYLTDPAKADSDGDGTPDGDWDERREYTYSVRTVLRYMPPFDEDGLNDDFQDGRVLNQTGEYIEVEVIHYPLATSYESIQENPNWRQDYARMSEYLAAGVTTNWDEQMKRDLLAALKADGINVETLTDKQVVEQVSRWLLHRSRSLDKVFTTYYVDYPAGRPRVYPGLEDAFRREFARDSNNYDWTIEQHFDHELLGKGMFYNKTHGSCTSTAVYLATVLRALGIPTRIVLVTPAVDASDRAQILMAKNAITHNRVRLTMLAGLGRSSHGWTNHTFNEVYVGNRWCRLDYSQLGCPTFGLHRFGLQTHLYTLNDLSDVNFAPTWGWRYAKGERNGVFQHDNPYAAVEVSELFGPHGNIPNPPFTAQDLASHPQPDMFLFYPARVNVWQEFIGLVEGGTFNKTGRPHQREFYDNIFDGIWLTRPQDILVMLFSLDTPERVPQGYEDLLPRPWPQIESLLKQGRTVELSGKARDMNVILLAAPTKDELTPLVRDSKLLRAPGKFTQEQGRRPSGPMPPPSAPFAVRVNENVEIELLGICDHPSEGRQWWRPDGSRREAAPYQTTGSRLEHKENYQDYEFALRVSGPRDTAIAWIVPGGTRGSDTGRARGADGRPLDDVHAYTSNQRADAERANVFIGVASGAWETCAVHTTLDREGSYTLEDNKAVAFGIAYMKGSDTLVPVTTNMKSKEANRRVIAVDANGEQHAGGGSGYGGNVLHSGTCRFDVPLSQIRELRFQRRPYTWVAIRNVSLRPGHATDVTAELMDTETMTLWSRRAPGQEKIWGIGLAWEALRDRAGKRYAGTIGGFSEDEKQCSEYFAQVLSRTAFGDTFVLMFAFDKIAAVPSQYADLLPLPWSEVESRVERGEPVEAQGKARNLNVVLLAAPTSEQLNALVRQTPLLEAFGAATPQEPEPTGQAPPDKRRLYLPDLETPDANTVLDLGTGQLLSAAPMEKDSQYFSRLGKGDIIYEYASDKSGLLCLRGARILTKSIPRSGEWLTTNAPQPDVQRPGFVVYFIEQVPCRYLIENAEGNQYELNIISIDKGDSGGALVEYAKAGETQSGPMEVTEENSFSVYGTVTDQSGRPMAGVEVTAHCGFATLMPTGRTVTDEAGRYTLHFKPGILSREVLLQAATICARKVGFYEANLCRQGGLAMADRMPSGEDQRRIARYTGVVLPNKRYELDFVMRPAARIEGELVDAQDKPLSARAFSRTSEQLALTGEKLYPSSNALAAIETDQNGAFVVESVPLESFWFEYGRRTPVKSGSIHFTTPGTWRVKLKYDESAPGAPRLMIADLQPPAPALGLLELRIAPNRDDLTPAVVEKHRNALLEGRTPPDGRYLWVPLRPGTGLSPDVVTQEYEGRLCLLVHDREPYIMVPEQGWRLLSVGCASDNFDRKMPLLRFDEQGAERWHRMTNMRSVSTVAIILSGRVVAAPQAHAGERGPMNTGTIVGVFTDQQVEDMIQSLREGIVTHGVESTSVEANEVKPHVAAGTGPVGQHFLSFDGVDDCLIVPASPSLTLKPPFCIEMWVKPNMPETQTPEKKGPYLALIRKGEKIPAPQSVAQYQKGGFVALVSPPFEEQGICYGIFCWADEQGSVAQKNTFRSDRPALGRPGWMHVLMEWPQGDYVSAPHAPLVIGENIAPYGIPFKGEIAEVRTWNKVLTPQEIRYYETISLTGNEPNLVACWTFEEGSGQIVRDISPNANHARLGGSAEADDADPQWARMGL